MTMCCPVNVEKQNKLVIRNEDICFKKKKSEEYMAVNKKILGELNLQAVGIEKLHVKEFKCLGSSVFNRECNREVKKLAEAK